jgi:hypothetical protein
MNPSSLAYHVAQYDCAFSVCRADALPFAKAHHIHTYYLSLQNRLDPMDANVEDRSVSITPPLARLYQRSFSRWTNYWIRDSTHVCDKRCDICGMTWLTLVSMTCISLRIALCAVPHRVESYRGFLLRIFSATNLVVRSVKRQPRSAPLFFVDYAASAATTCP